MNNSAPVVTLTPAGAIDATYHVSRLELGGFVRAADYEREVSGKGVNVSAALAHAGRESAAVVVLGDDDVAFARHCAHAALLRIVTVPGATRVNTSIIDAGGATTKVNAPAPPLARDAWERAVSATLDELDRRRAGWLVISGTIPPLEDQSVPADLGELLREVAARGIRIAIDTSGEALARAAANPRAIALLKPNTHELADLAGRELRTIGDVAAASGELVARGVGAVYTSMGADGVLVVAPGVTVHAQARAVRVANTAGAGDASLAGYLVGFGLADTPDRYATAAAAAASWGAHAVAQTSTILPHLDALPLATIVLDPDPSIPLTEPAVTS
ncbi:1-phosphofructokinase family hexose kinase [Luethyella okanaganae]|uniref:1-phosphofructokinase family hexose kinase n=1 Tax=Luethyella okanaganae TaxID=69372 RepID=A0ABW1VH79_9MICO